MVLELEQGVFFSTKSFLPRLGATESGQISENLKVGVKFRDLETTKNRVEVTQLLKVKNQGKDILDYSWTSCFGWCISKSYKFVGNSLKTSEKDAFQCDEKEKIRGKEVDLIEYRNKVGTQGCFLCQSWNGS